MNHDEVADPEYYDMVHTYNEFRWPISDIPILRFYEEYLRKVWTTTLLDMLGITALLAHVAVPFSELLALMVAVRPSGPWREYCS